MDGEKSPDEAVREILINEYREVSASYRSHVNLRFIAAAFITAIQSGILGAYYQSLANNLPEIRRIFFPSVGIMILLGATLIEARTRVIILSTIERGKEIEVLMREIRGYFSRLSALGVPGLWEVATHTKGIRFIYSTIMTMWLVILLTEAVEVIRQIVVILSKKGV